MSAASPITHYSSICGNLPSLQDKAITSILTSNCKSLSSINLHSNLLSSLTVDRNIFDCLTFEKVKDINFSSNELHSVNDIRKPPNQLNFLNLTTNLLRLDLSANNLSSLETITNTLSGGDSLPFLETLNLSYNNISSLGGLSVLTLGLVEVDLRGNNFNSVNDLKELRLQKNLSKLILQDINSSNPMCLLTNSNSNTNKNNNTNNQQNN